jgi:hypothetical protein
MKKRQSMGITRAAAVAAFVAGLGGVAHASILSAGGFPGATVNTGFAQCVLTNTGTRDVTVKSATLLDDAGTAKVQESGWIVSPGQTRVFAYVPMSNTSASSCVFDVSTKNGVRASFVYLNGSTVTVIPAQK